MPSLVVIIVWLAVAGMMILIGTALTVRRNAAYRSGQFYDVRCDQRMNAVQCYVCGNETDDATGVMYNGRTYDPVCQECQYCTGIRCPDGTISADYYYQVEPLARL